MAAETAGPLPASAFDSIPDAIASFRDGGFLVVLDDPARENEADLIIAAEDVTTAQMAFLIRYSSGFVCAPLAGHLADAWRLGPMVARNEDPRGTAYTVSVDAADPSVGTGISARDRALTCRVLARGPPPPPPPPYPTEEGGPSPSSGPPPPPPQLLRRPGHVMPLRARDGGVRTRPGHTEAAVDLCRLAGKRPAAVICELVDDGLDEVAGRAEREGSGMLRGEACVAFARRFGLRVCTIADLAAYLDLVEGGVARFDALAASWWDPHGPSRILHLMNPLRHDFIRRCRSEAPPLAAAPGRTRGLRYLDVGCGGGIFAESAARLASTARVVGIDPSGRLVAAARAHARQDPGLPPHRLTYLDASIESLDPAVEPDRFDTVSLFEVLEHVAAPADLLARAGPFVRPGGWLVASTIARTFASWLTTKLLAEDLLRAVPRGTHDWARYIDARELEAMLLLGAARGGEEADGPGGEVRRWAWGSPRCEGVVYVPGLGWRVVPGSERVGNYFFAVRKEIRPD